MIPVKYLEDLKTAPIKEVDFVATFIEVGPDDAVSSETSEC